MEVEAAMIVIVIRREERTRGIRGSASGGDPRVHDHCGASEDDGDRPKHDETQAYAFMVIKRKSVSILCHIA